MSKVYSMENKTHTKFFDKLEKSIVDSPESMFAFLKLEMETEFFVHFQPESNDEGKGKKVRFLIEDSPDHTIISTMKNDEQPPAKFSINDKIWIGPENKNFEPKTMDTMENLFFIRFGYRFDLAHYYRIKTEKQVLRDDFYWSWFVTHGIFYIPKSDRWYSLSFAAYYMKPKIGYEHKNSTNPYCGVHWRQFSHTKRPLKLFWKYSPERKYMGLNMRIAITNQTLKVESDDEFQ